MEAETVSWVLRHLKGLTTQTMSPTVCKTSFWVKQELYYWLFDVFIDCVTLLEAQVLWI
jgi:hypothetical protein